MSRHSQKSQQVKQKSATQISAPMDTKDESNQEFVPLTPESISEFLEKNYAQARTYAQKQNYLAADKIYKQMLVRLGKSLDCTDLNNRAFIAQLSGAMKTLHLELAPFCLTYGKHHLSLKEWQFAIHAFNRALIHYREVSDDITIELASTEAEARSLLIQALIEILSCPSDQQTFLANYCQLAKLLNKLRQDSPQWPKNYYDALIKIYSHAIDAYQARADYLAKQVTSNLNEVADHYINALYAMRFLDSSLLKTPELQTGNRKRCLTMSMTIGNIFQQLALENSTFENNSSDLKKAENNDQLHLFLNNIIDNVNALSTQLPAHCQNLERYFRTTRLQCAQLKRSKSLDSKALENAGQQLHLLSISVRYYYDALKDASLLRTDPAGAEEFAQLHNVLSNYCLNLVGFILTIRLLRAQLCEQHELWQAAAHEYEDILSFRDCPEVFNQPLLLPYFKQAFKNLTTQLYDSPEEQLDSKSELRKNTAKIPDLKKALELYEKHRTPQGVELDQFKAELQKRFTNAAKDPKNPYEKLSELIDDYHFPLTKLEFRVRKNPKNNAMEDEKDAKNPVNTVSISPKKYLSTLLIDERNKQDMLTLVGMRTWRLSFNPRLAQQPTIITIFTPEMSEYKVIEANTPFNRSLIKIVLNYLFGKNIEGTNLLWLAEERLAKVSAGVGNFNPAPKASPIVLRKTPWGTFYQAIQCSDPNILINFAIQNSTKESIRDLLAPEIQVAAAQAAQRLNHNLSLDNKEVKNTQLQGFPKNTHEELRILFNLCNDNTRVLVEKYNRSLGRQPLRFEEVLKWLDEQKEETPPLKQALLCAQQIKKNFASLQTAIYPTTLKPSELDNFFNNDTNCLRYPQAYQLFQLITQQVQDCNRLLHRTPYDLDQLDAFFKKSLKKSTHAELFKEFQKERQQLTSYEEKFAAYCKREDVYCTYLNDYYVPTGWSIFKLDFKGGPKTTFMIDIAARVLHTNIVIHQEVFPGVLQMIYRTNIRQVLNDDMHLQYNGTQFARISNPKIKTDFKANKSAQTKDQPNSRKRKADGEDSTTSSKRPRILSRPPANKEAPFVLSVSTKAANASSNGSQSMATESDSVSNNSNSSNNNSNNSLPTGEAFTASMNRVSLFASMPPMFQGNQKPKHEKKPTRSSTRSSSRSTSTLTGPGLFPASANRASASSTRNSTGPGLFPRATNTVATSLNGIQSMATEPDSSSSSSSGAQTMVTESDSSFSSLPTGNASGTSMDFNS